MSKDSSSKHSKRGFDPRIVRAHNGYVAAINSNNTARVMAMYDAEAVIMQPDGPLITHSSKPVNIRQWVEGYFKAYKTHWVKKSQLIWVAGDYGFDQGHDTAVDTPRAGGPISGASVVKWDVKGILIYKKQKNGEFLVYRDIWNSNIAPRYIGGALTGVFAPG